MTFSHDFSNFSTIPVWHDVWFLTKVPETVTNCCHNCPAQAWNTRLIALASFSYPQEHVNFVGRDGENGPVLVSVKAETVAGQEHWRVLLRLRAGSTHDLVPASNLSPNPTPTKMVKVMATVVHLQQWSLTVGITSRDKIQIRMSREVRTHVNLLEILRKLNVQ